LDRSHRSATSSFVKTVTTLTDVREAIIYTS
jgi:hypothetical protein